MKLYEINSAIMNLIDPETGELTDTEAFENLQMERTEKLEGLALWYKDLAAEAAAIKAEEKNLADRRIATEKKAESVKNFLQNELQGEKLKTPRCAVSYRRSSKVQTEPEFLKWAMDNDDSLLSYKTPTPSLSAIKEAINAGHKIPYAEIIETSSMSIK